MNDAFAVIGDHNTVALARLPHHELPKTTSRRLAEPIAAFAVEPDDLLMSGSCNDPVFLNGRVPAIAVNAAGRDADLLQALEQGPTGLISADDTAGAYFAAKRTDVVHDIHRAAHPEVLAGDSQHRHRRL